MENNELVRDKKKASRYFSLTETMQRIPIASLK